MAQKCFYDEYEVYDALSDVCMEKKKRHKEKIQNRENICNEMQGTVQ